MKRMFYLILALPSLALAQPVIQNIDNYTIGESYTRIVANPTNVMPGSAGANQHWMFDGLPYLDSAKTWCIAPSSTSYAAQFPTATVVTKTEDGRFSFFEKTPAANRAIGTVDSSGGGISIAHNYIAAKRPFTFNDSYTESYTTTSMGSTGAGTFTVTADGYGMLHLPGGNNHMDVLRVKMEVNQDDTTTIGPAMVYIKLTGVRYTWYSNKFKTPLLSWDSTTVTTIVSGTSTVDIFRTVDYLKYEQSATGIGHINPEKINCTATIQRDQLIITGDFVSGRAYHVSLFNLNGQRIFETDFTATGSQWTGEVPTDLTAGVYLLTINDSHSVSQTVKLVKE